MVKRPIKKPDSNLQIVVGDWVALEKEKMWGKQLSKFQKELRNR